MNGLCLLDDEAERRDAIIRAHVRAALSADDCAQAVTLALGHQHNRDMVIGRARRIGVRFRCSEERRRRKISDGMRARWAKRRAQA